MCLLSKDKSVSPLSEGFLLNKTTSGDGEEEKDKEEGGEEDDDANGTVEIVVKDVDAGGTIRADGEYDDDKDVNDDEVESEEESLSCFSICSFSARTAGRSFFRAITVAVPFMFPAVLLIQNSPITQKISTLCYQFDDGAANGRVVN